MKVIVKANPYRLGLVAIAALGALSLVVLGLSVASFGQKTYTAQLEHTAGIRAGEDVQIAGVSVGEVKGVELDGDQVIVTFTVDNDIRLGEDTTAAVRVATLLGTHMLKVDPKGAGSLEDDRVPLDQTSVPFNLQDVLEQGAKAVGDLDGKLLAQALSAASDALESGSDDLGPALQGIQRVGDVVAVRTNQAQDLLVAAKSVSEQLAAGSADFIELLKQSQLVLDEITSRRKVIHKLLVDTAALAKALTAITKSTDKHIAPTMRDLNITLDTLRANEANLREAFRILAPTSRYLANATGSGPWGDIYLPGVTFDALTCKLEGGC